MDFAKFMDLLTTKKLYFHDAKKFDDKYEGLLPESFYKRWSKGNEEGHKRVDKAMDELKSAFVCSWNEFEGVDSNAMWRIYEKEDIGVFIRTTVGDLKNALNDEKIKLYRVKYIDSFDEKDTNLEIPFYDVGTDFNFNMQRVKEVCKYGAYKYESEIRAIFYNQYKQDCFGIKCDVNLDILINSICVSPYAPDWFVDLVKRIVKDEHYGINGKTIEKSKIRL